MQIEYVDINIIKPYPNNPRFNRKTINKLKELLVSNQVVFNVPIVLDKNNVIVKGHARWTALKELDYKIVPVIYSNNSDELNDQDRLEDNIIQELSTWRNEELAIEIRENNIDPAEYNLGFKTLGYTSAYSPDVTKEEVQHATATFMGTGQSVKEYIELVCPYCGEEFMIDRNEVKRYE